MATTTTVHAQLIRYADNGDQVIVNLKNTGADVSITRTNTKLPTSVTSAQTLANALGNLAFKDSLSKSDVGLSNVDNTADSAKSVKYATSAGSMGEANLTWGGKNFAGSYGPIDAAMIPALGANRLAFISPDSVTAEYSRDGGSTWTDYGASSDTKRGLFSTGGTFAIGKADSTNKATANTDKYQLRITIDTDKASVYTVLNKFAIYLSTNGSNSCWCSIDASLESTPTTWVNFANKVSVSGWSGWNIINTNGITTYGNNKTVQYGLIRLTFGSNGGNTSYNGLQITQILAYGGVGWTTPSNMSRTGHLYSYDIWQNATFPATIYANNALMNTCASCSNWNDAVKTGWYMASGASNAPTTGSWYFGMVIAHNTNYVIQELYQFTASTDAKSIPKYIRAKMNGTWGSWTEVTVQMKVPTGSKFTDTVYTHPSHTAYASGLYKITTNSLGHVTAATAVTKADITGLGIPASDTNTWRGIQDNLTSSSASDSLSANQGKVLKGLVDGKLPLSGGTVTGKTTFQQGTIVHSATGTAGTAGYINIATFKISSNYQNEPIEITFSRRSDAAVTRLSIAFTSANSTDPSLNVFRCMGATNAAWLYKSATSTWQLYIQKTEGYDNIGILAYHHPSYMSGTSVTWTNVQASSVPAGATQASYGYNVGYASSAGSVAWGNVSGKTNATSSASGLMSDSDKAKLDFGDILYVSKSTPTRACIWAKLD